MVFEQQKISDTEVLVSFPKPLALKGTFYHNRNETGADTDFSEYPDFFTAIILSDFAEELLLTGKFLYIKSTTQKELEDAEALALAELDEYSPPSRTVFAPEKDTVSKIRIILKTIIAPFLQKDGGNIELLSYENRTAFVRFLGRCHGCPYAQQTLKERVEKNLTNYLPEIAEVVLK